MEGEFVVCRFEFYSQPGKGSLLDIDELVRAWAALSLFRFLPSLPWAVRGGGELGCRSSSMEYACKQVLAENQPH